MRKRTLIVFACACLLAVSVGSGTADEAPALAGIEGKHIILRVSPEDLAHLDHPHLWVAKLDKAYEAMADLVGNTPFDGAKIVIEAVEENPGGWAVAGNPILWHRPHVVKTFEELVNRGDWCFGIVHEISHDFDLDDRWNWSAELLANFKMDYAFEQSKALVMFGDQPCNYADPSSPKLRDMYQAAETKLGYPPSSRMRHGGWLGDAYHHKLTAVVDEVGWEPLKRTFRWFLAQRRQDLPNDLLGKRSVFVLAIAEQSGVDITNRFIDWGFNQLTVRGTSNTLRAARKIRAREWKARIVSRPIHAAVGEPVTIRVEVIDRNPVTYGKGLGMHADAEIVYDLRGKYRRFESLVGLPGTEQAEGGWGSVAFAVVTDGEKAYESHVMRGGEKPQRVSLDVTGRRDLRLLVSDGGDGIFGDGCAWVDAKLIDRSGRVTYLSDLTPVSQRVGYGTLCLDTCNDGSPLTFVFGPSTRRVVIDADVGTETVPLRRGKDPAVFECTLDDLDEGTHLIRLRVRVGSDAVTQHELVTVVIGP